MSRKGISAYSWLVFILIILFAAFMLALQGCADYRFVSKEQKQRVKQIRKETKKDQESLSWTHFGLQSDSAKWQGMKYRPEHFYWSDQTLFHVDYRGQHSKLNWSDIQVLGIDSLRKQYLEYYAERE